MHCFTIFRPTRTIVRGLLLKEFKRGAQLTVHTEKYQKAIAVFCRMRGKYLTTVQELCESRGGRPGLSVLTSLLVSVDVKLY